MRPWLTDSQSSPADRSAGHLAETFDDLESSCARLESLSETKSTKSLKTAHGQSSGRGLTELAEGTEERTHRDELAAATTDHVDEVTDARGVGLLPLLDTTCFGDCLLDVLVGRVGPGHHERVHEARDLARVEHALPRLVVDEVRRVARANVWSTESQDAAATQVPHAVTEPRADTGHSFFGLQQCIRRGGSDAATRNGLLA